MIVKPSAFIWMAAGFMGIIASIALIDRLGNLRWFWPYDDAVWSVALLTAVLWQLFIGRRMAAWAKDEDESP